MLVRSFAGKKGLTTMEAMDRKSVDVVPQNAGVVLLVVAGRIASMSRAFVFCCWSSCEMLK